MDAAGMAGVVTQPELAGMPERPASRPAMLERELQAGVIDTARIFGWRVAHFRSVPVRRGRRVVWETPVMADGAGFPDLILVRDEVLAVELKVGRNTLSAEQADWLEAFRAAGVEAFVWTEHDWYDGAIEARLRRHG